MHAFLKQIGCEPWFPWKQLLLGYDVGNVVANLATPIFV